MSMYNNPNDPKRDRPEDLGGPGLRSDVRRGDMDRGGNFWPWIIGLLVLLAVGWIVIEAFDRDEVGVDEAVPAAGQIEDDRYRPETVPPAEEPMRDTTPGMNEDLPRPSEQTTPRGQDQLQD